MKVEINKTYTISLDEKEKVMLKDALSYFFSYCIDKEEYAKEIDFASELYSKFENT